MNLIKLFFVSVLALSSIASADMAECYKKCGNESDIALKPCDKMADAPKRLACMQQVASKLSQCYKTCDQQPVERLSSSDRRE